MYPQFNMDGYIPHIYASFILLFFYTQTVDSFFFSPYPFLSELKQRMSHCIYSGLYPYLILSLSFPQDHPCLYNQNKVLDIPYTIILLIVIKILCIYNLKTKERKKSFFFSFFRLQCVTQYFSILFNWERWLSGLKRRIANPLYELFVPRVRIPLFPFLLMT